MPKSKSLEFNLTIYDDGTEEINMKYNDDIMTIASFLVSVLNGELYAFCLAKLSEKYDDDELEKIITLVHEIEAQDLQTECMKPSQVFVGGVK